VVLSSEIEAMNMKPLNMMMYKAPKPELWESVSMQRRYENA
jgi:hypothetical protein